MDRRRKRDPHPCIRIEADDQELAARLQHPRGLARGQFDVRPTQVVDGGNAHGRVELTSLEWQLPHVGGPDVHPVGDAGNRGIPLETTGRVVIDAVVAPIQIDCGHARIRVREQNAHGRPAGPGAQVDTRTAPDDRNDGVGSRTGSLI